MRAYPRQGEMSSGRRVCPRECSGGQGEVDVVGVERAREPGLASSTALVRCAECQRISIASMDDGLLEKPHALGKAGLRTPLGRFVMFSGSCQ
jgi:hypothetical protein